MRKNIIIPGMFFLLLAVSHAFAWDNEYRIDALGEKVNQVDDKIRSTDSKVDALVSRINHLEDRIRDIDSRQEALESKMDRAEQLEERIRRLESPKDIS